MTSLFDRPGGAIAVAAMATMNRAAEAEAIQLLRPAPADRVLVLGFGPGIGIRLLAKHLARGGAVVGVDPSTTMMKAASAANRANLACGRVTLHVTTAERVPADQASFDGAIAVNTLQFCEPFAATANELARVLKPGARMVSLTHDWALARHAGSSSAWLEAVRAVLVAAHFDEIEDGRGLAEKGRIVRLTARRQL